MTEEPSAEAKDRLIDQFDARIWAEEYCKINPSADHMTMFGWFANAIMAGHDNAMRKQDAAVRRAVEEERERCIAAACEWLYPENLIYDCSMESALRREDRKISLRIALTGKEAADEKDVPELLV